MTDPMDSIGAEAEGGLQVGPEGEAVEAQPQGSAWAERAIELFKPCPEDPLSKKGFISQSVNGWLSRRGGVPVEEIEVGENLAHCIDHLFPGSASGLPPILNLARSIMAYRDAAHRHPDNGKLVRP